jgi:hypothetical protein
MTVWSWKFHTAKVADENGLTDVLKSVGYQLTGTRGEGEDTKSYEIGGETALGAPDPANFIPFASLTEANLVAIVSTSVNIEAIKAQIDAWHNEKIKPLPGAGLSLHSVETI